jgi:hypothetical protein
MNIERDGLLMELQKNQKKEKKHEWHIERNQDHHKGKA